MSRLIDADALIAWIKGSQQMTSKMKCVIAKIETMSDAVSVVHGEWIDEHEDGHGSWVGTCSQCHNTERVNKFCPNCGCRMKGADDENV